MTLAGDVLDPRQCQIMLTEWIPLPRSQLSDIFASSTSPPLKEIIVLPQAAFAALLRKFQQRPAADALHRFLPLLAKVLCILLLVPSEGPVVCMPRRSIRTFRVG